MNGVAIALGVILAGLAMLVWGFAVIGALAHAGVGVALLVLFLGLVAAANVLIAGGLRGLRR